MLPQPSGLQDEELVGLYRHIAKNMVTQNQAQGKGI
jgi:hypothetical protein